MAVVINEFEVIPERPPAPPRPPEDAQQREPLSAPVMKAELERTIRERAERLIRIQAH